MHNTHAGAITKKLIVYISFQFSACKSLKISLMLKNFREYIKWDERVIFFHINKPAFHTNIIKDQKDIVF